MEITEAPPTQSIVSLSTLTLAAGVGGMAFSFLYLASSNQLDVLAGGVGFVAGSILIAAGLLSLAIQSRSPAASKVAIRVLRCFYGLLPGVVAIVAWPMLYFGLFLLGILLMPLVLIACAIWAWWGSGSVAKNLCALLGWSWIRTVHCIVFSIQLIEIAASLPLFRIMLDTLESMGSAGPTSTPRPPTRV